MLSTITAQLLLCNLSTCMQVSCRFGSPETLITDQGREFVNELSAELYSITQTCIVCQVYIIFIVLEFLDAQMHAYFHGGMPIFTVNMGIGMPVFT